MEHVRAECAAIDAAVMQQLSSDGVSVTLPGGPGAKQFAEAEVPTAINGHSGGSWRVWRSAAYLAEVTRRLATGQHCRSLDQYEHHLRRLCDAELRRRIGIQLEDARELTRRAVAEKRARSDMEKQDARLQAQRQAQWVRAQETRRRLVGARLAAIDRLEFRCNGKPVGMMHTHIPGCRFTPLRHEHHAVWTDAEFAAWRWSLAEAADGCSCYVQAQCEICFEGTNFPNGPRRELRDAREEARLERLRDGAVFQCRFRRFASNGYCYPRSVSCGAEFSPVRPSGWSDAEFATWRRGLVGVVGSRRIDGDRRVSPLFLREVPAPQSRAGSRSRSRRCRRRRRRRAGRGGGGRRRRRR